MFVQIRQKLLFNTVVRHGKQKKYSVFAISEVKDKINDTAEPVYPAIKDTSLRSKMKRRRESWYNKIKALETVEEKLFKINMPRYYGWKSLVLNEHFIPYNALSHTQYITRTHIIKELGLPAYYDNVISTEQLNSIVQVVKTDIEDNIVFEHCTRRREHEIETKTLDGDRKDLETERNIKNVVTNALIQRINRTMLVHLSSKYPHLLHSQVDFDPRLEASWFVGGIYPPQFVKKARRSIKFLKYFVNDPVNLPVKYLGQPAMHLRHKHPLREIISLNECENPALDVPTFKYFPTVLSYKTTRKHLTNIPGFWPGDVSEFGLLSYHNSSYLHGRPKEYNDTSTALTVQAVLASYSWLLSQACYQGFSTFNEITYPLTTQTVITNGQWWSFFVYQLNTTLVHSEHVDKNPRRNVCWITEPLKLFDKIENEKVYGLNEEVLKTLIKFYVNTPEKKVDVDLKPYLGESVKVIAEIEHDERRNWLEKHYKHLVSDRPRHRRIPEIYQWQEIYIRRHKTCPMHKKREPWQFGINVFKRRLNDHKPPYIPRCLRANPKKRKVGRWAKTYYP